MSRTLGTVVRGVRAPIFREGDNVVDITVSTVLNALQDNAVTARDGDVVAVTESVVARCQGNYATCEQIAADVRAKTGGKTVGVAFPILSRNRFSLLLRGIALGAEKVVLLLSYPSDEVGNHLVSLDQLDEAGIDPWHDVLSLEQFRAAFGQVVHPFTGVDYVDYYKSIIEEAGAQAEIVFANRVTAIVPYTDTVITCDIHTRQRSKRLLTAAGAKVVLGLDDLLTAPVDGSGCNPQYGLLGSNKADDDRVKLFPRDAKAVAEAIGKAMSEATGKRIEAMVYGDGAFKDPAGKIWELADPVVAPGYTGGLVGTPAEGHLREDPRQGRQAVSGGQYGVRGHHAPEPDRPDRLPVRPDQRQRRQGHAHHLHPGLFRQLHQRISNGSPPASAGGLRSKKEHPHGCSFCRYRSCSQRGVPQPAVSK